MNLKTFRGNSMAQALAEVKKDLGRDAVILHTRTLRVGGVLGVGAKAIVEITASDADPSLTSPRPKPRPRTRVPATRLPATIPAPMPASVSEAVLDRAGEFVAGSPWDSQPNKPAQRVAHPANPVKIDLTTAPTRPSPAPQPVVASPLQPPLPTALPLPTVRLHPSTSLESELGQIKSMLGHVMRSTRTGAIDIGAMPTALLGAYTSMIEQEIPDAIAETILGEVREQLQPDELASPELVRQTVLRRIASRIPVCEQWPPARSADRPAVVALVGPTGVGKTTTLAKLAAGLRLRRGMRVGLVTCDTYRIAAVEQLRTYAEIIGVPLKVALSPEELGDCLASLGDCDLVLVDTAGRSQHDADRLAELRRLIEVARPDQTHLVLSAASSPGVLKRACEKFAVLGPDRLLLTKVDEAVGLGPVLDILDRTRLPMGFVSTGQEVPDHIERVRSDRMARRIMGAVVPREMDDQPRPEQAASIHETVAGGTVR